VHPSHQFAGVLFCSVLFCSDSDGDTDTDSDNQKNNSHLLLAAVWVGTTDARIHLTYSLMRSLESPFACQCPSNHHHQQEKVTPFHYLTNTTPPGREPIYTSAPYKLIVTCARAQFSRGRVSERVDIPCGTGTARSLIDLLDA